MVRVDRTKVEWTRTSKPKKAGAGSDVSVAQRKAEKNGSLLEPCSVRAVFFFFSLWLDLTLTLLITMII